MSKLNFRKLDKNYSGRYNQGKCKLDDQCAVRLSKALAKSGFLLNDFAGTNTCTVDDILHVRGSRSLADHTWKT